MGAQIGAYLDGVVVVVEHIRPRGRGTLEQRGAVVEAVELVATLWGELDVHHAATPVRGARERERERGVSGLTHERRGTREREREGNEKEGDEVNGSVGWFGMSVR